MVENMACGEINERSFNNHTPDRCQTATKHDKRNVWYVKEGNNLIASFAVSQSCKTLFLLTHAPGKTLYT